MKKKPNKNKNSIGHIYWIQKIKNKINFIIAVKI